MKSESDPAITPGPPSRGRRPPIPAFAPFIDPDLPPLGIAVVVALLVMSLGIHEAAHGWVALKCGDTTARDLGRITLNPLAHVDLFMTVILPAVTYMSAGFFFGGAKPVPVVFHNLRHPWRDMALVALAGPVSNFLLAGFFLLCHKVVVQEMGIWDSGALGAAVLNSAVLFNLLLAAFNLLPIPPLDGSRVMAWLLPRSLRGAFANLERFGLYIVIFAMFLVPGFTTVIRVTMRVLYDAIESIVTLGGAW